MVDQNIMEVEKNFMADIIAHREDTAWALEGKPERHITNWYHEQIQQLQQQLIERLKLV